MTDSYEGLRERHPNMPMSMRNTRRGGSKTRPTAAGDRRAGLKPTPILFAAHTAGIQQGVEKVGTDVILRSEATKNLLSVPLSRSENSRSFASLRMTR
jgi:hypothetical protein